MENTLLKEEDFTPEELERCRKSPRYFYNKYWKIYDKDGNEIPKKELSEEEWNERIVYLERLRHTPIIRRGMEYPLTTNECFEKK